MGGAGWRNQSTGEVRYQAADPSGEHATDKMASPHGANGKAVSASPGTNGKADRPEALGHAGTNGKPTKASQGKSSQAAQVSEHAQKSIAAAEQKIKQPGFWGQAAKLPKTVAVATKKFIANLYAKTEQKYGKGWARAVVAVGLLTLPTPVTMGCVAATLGLAHIFTHGGKQAAPAKMAEVQMTEEQVKTAAVELLKTIMAGFKQIAATLKESGETFEPPVAQHMNDAVSVLTAPAKKTLIEPEKFADDDPGIYHGPKPPGPGWVSAGVGPKGGKMWRHVGQGHGHVGATGDKPPHGDAGHHHAVHPAHQHGQPPAQHPGDIEPTAKAPEHHHPPEHGAALYNPNPLAPNAQTGIPDHARVGVPAMSVPPPPKEIGRLPNLDEKQRKVESRFAEKYLADPDGMAEKYLKALRKGKVGVAPNVFATDDVKALNPDWNPMGTGGEPGAELTPEAKKAMAKYNAAVHQTANAIAKRAFVKYLDDVVAKLPPERRSVLVTQGGCAAGKGSSLSRAQDPNDPHYGMLPATEQVGAVYDSAGEQNATENAWVYEECRKRGIKATFAYVWADPEQGWDSEDRGVIRRAMRKGRMVDARLFADSYALGAKNMNAFYQKYKGQEGADFIFLDNRSKSNPKLLDSFPEETLKWDADKIFRSAVAGLENRRGDLDKTLVNAGLAGQKIWGAMPKLMAGDRVTAREYGGEPWHGTIEHRLPDGSFGVRNERGDLRVFKPEDIDKGFESFAENFISSPTSPGAGSAAATKAEAVAFDEFYHGPQAPGAGWVPAGTGPKGGHIWKRAEKSESHKAGSAMAHTGHEAHLVHEAHQVAEVFGQHAADMHQEIFAAHAGEVAEAAGHAHDFSDLDAFAIIARNNYGPVLKAAKAIVNKTPGGKRTGEAIAALHEGATKLGESMTKKLVDKYGHATAGAILGAGAVMASMVQHAVGVGTVGRAVPGQRFIGAIPLIALAEIGKRLGLIGKDTMFEKGLARFGSWVHAIRAAVGHPLKRAGEAISKAGLKAAHAAGETVGDYQRRIAKLEHGLGTDPGAVEHAESLSDDQIKAIAKEFMEEYMGGFAKLLEESPLGKAEHVEEFDEFYHGPKPPDPKGWVSAGQGPRGGKRWKRAGTRKTPDAYGREGDEEKTVEEIASMYKAARPGASDTATMYTTSDGKWTPEREALHKSIIGRELQGKTPVDRPVAYLLGGAPASGKTTLSQSGLMDVDQNHVKVAPDDWVMDIPEYRTMLAAKDIKAGDFVYQETSLLGKKLAVTAMQARYNLLMDGIGDRSMEYLTERSNKLRKSGHKIVAHYVTVNVDEALKRNIDRAKKTGRFVPESNIRELHAAVSNLLPEAVKAGLFDEFSLWDTEGSDERPALVASAVKGVLKIHNQAAWDKFVAKGKAE